MAKTVRVCVGFAALAALLLIVRLGTAQTKISTAGHAAVGSYFGMAIQVCPSGVAPSACANGQPASALFMTPTVLADGLFVADDSFALLGAPFGPHLSAHGSWEPFSPTEFTADYVFMSNPYPPVASGVAIAGLRARWLAKVVDAETVTGYVNAYFLPPVPVVWQPLVRASDFPVLPPEAAPFYTSPSGYVTDPSLCRTADCPLVFKFTLKRIRK